MDLQHAPNPCVRSPITFWHILHHVRRKCLPWSECRSCRSLLRCSAHVVTTVAGGWGNLHVAEVGRTASGQGEHGAWGTFQGQAAQCRLGSSDVQVGDPIPQVPFGSSCSLFPLPVKLELQGCCWRSFSKQFLLEKAVFTELSFVGSQRSADLGSPCKEEALYPNYLEIRSHANQKLHLKSA